MVEATFLKFGELPTEIRIMIWTEAALEPRIMEFALVHDGEHLEPHVNLLLACKEAAEVVLPICKDSPVHTQMGRRNVYFNYERDIMYVTGILRNDENNSATSPFDQFSEVKLCLKQCIKLDPKRIRHLAFGMDLGVCRKKENLWRSFGKCHDEAKVEMLTHWIEDLHYHIHRGFKMPGLETITLVFDSTKQERRPPYYDHTAAKDFNIFDETKSHLLQLVQKKIFAKIKKNFLNAQKRAPGAFAEELQNFPPLTCTCGNVNPSLKLLFGTVVRERIGTRHETVSSKTVVLLHVLTIGNFRTLFTH
jgi:hypothetical protein